MIEIKPLVGYEGYYASSEGEILDKDHNKLEKKVNTRGYYTVYMRGKTLLVHLLMLRAFKPVKDKAEKNLLGNHYDLNRLNNHIDNLEWVTSEWNNIHHVLFRNKNPDRPHIKVIKPNSEVILFNTIEEVSNYYNLSIKDFWNAFKEGSYNEDKLVYLKWDDKDVLRVVREQHLCRDIEAYGKRTPAKRGVKIIDLETSEIKSYESLNSAAKDHNVRITHIRNRLSKPEKFRIFKGKYVIIDAEGNFDFLTENVKQILLSRGRKSVVAYNLETMRFYFYKSAYEFIKKNNLRDKKSPITKNLKNGIIPNKGIWRYMYSDDIPGIAQIKLYFKIFGKPIVK